MRIAKVAAAGLLHAVIAASSTIAPASAAEVLLSTSDQLSAVSGDSQWGMFALLAILAAGGLLIVSGVRPAARRQEEITA